MDGDSFRHTGVIPPRQNLYNPKWVPGEVIVKFKDSVKLQLGKQDGIVQTGISSLDQLHEELKVFEIEKVFKQAKKRTLSKRIKTHPSKTA